MVAKLDRPLPDHPSKALRDSTIHCLFVTIAYNLLVTITGFSQKYEKGVEILRCTQDDNGYNNRVLAKVRKER
jgi:hypothetical protein